MRIKTNYSHILLNTLISRKLKLLANRCRFALPIFEEKYKVIINTSDMLLLLWFVIRRCYFVYMRNIEVVCNLNEKTEDTIIQKLSFVKTIELGRFV